MKMNDPTNAPGCIGHWSLVIGHSSRVGHPRPGITLLELLVALGILVAIAAIAAPSMARAWERYRVKLAGDQLRAEFSHAHVEAMRTGQIQVLRFQLGGSSFFLQPWMAGDETINVSAAEAYEQSQPQYQTEPVKEQKLQEGVLFSLATAEFDTRSQEIEEEAVKQQTGQSPWSQPILFYPDGTSSQASVILANERGEAVMVKLRKLTGLTTVSDLSTVEQLAAATKEQP